MAYVRYVKFHSIFIGYFWPDKVHRLRKNQQIFAFKKITNFFLVAHKFIKKFVKKYLILPKHEEVLDLFYKLISNNLRIIDALVRYFQENNVNIFGFRLAKGAIKRSDKHFFCTFLFSSWSQEFFRDVL